MWLRPCLSRKYQLLYCDLPRVLEDDIQKTVLGLDCDYNHMRKSLHFLEVTFRKFLCIFIVFGTQFESFQPRLQAFVKTTITKGCFVTMAPNLDARIRVVDLSSKYINDPAKLFPSGKLVKGR